MSDFLHFIFPGLPISKEKQLAQEIIAELKYDENQPRDEIGRWTAGSTVTPNNIDDFRSNKWKMKHEEGLLISRNSEIVKVQKGTADKIKLSDQDVDRMKDGEFIHNHPGGTGLSDSDYVVAQKANLQRIEAFGYDPFTGENVIWVSERPANGWPGELAVRATRRGVEPAIISQARTRIRTEGISLDEAAHWATEQILTKMTDRLGIKVNRYVNSR